MGPNLQESRASHTATRLLSGKVLVAGGFGTGGILANTELYDPATNGWSSAGSLRATRSYHTATLLSSGKVLLTGGQDSSGNLASAELYDSATNSWSSAGSLGTARYDHTATLLPSGKVLVVGGFGTGGLLASTELYDPATDRWSSASSLGTARYHHTATLLPSGKVLVIGGYGGGVFAASTELYDPATNSWSSASSLVLARAYHTATLLPSGKVLVIGGSVAGGGLAASTELYDPATNSWGSVSSLAPARAYHTETVLPSGKVLVTGGSSAGGYLANAQRYDPATNGWGSAGSLATERHFHTATLLLSGKVLIAGGGSNSGLLASTELYEPAVAPNAATALTPTTGDGVVALRWAAPTDDGGSAIIGYTVFMAPASGGSSGVACATNGALGCTVSGLTNGQAYSFSVRASNAVGDGSLSAAVQATPQQIANPSVPMAGVPGGGNASVQISGAPAGCTVGALQIDSAVPPGAPSNAGFPLGVLRFTATGCDNATLTVRVTYPSAIPATAELRKYGPQTFGAPNSWFSPSGASISGDRLTATYQVTDNGEGDSDGTLGRISDPFAPMVLAAAPGPSGVASIPTLNQWGLILLSLMATAMGMVSVRRRS